MKNQLTRWIAPILWAPLLVLVAACDGESTTGPVTTITGAWVLTTVNGAALPLTLAESAEGKLEVVSGSVTLATGSRFASRLTMRETVSGVSSLSIEDVVGRFTVSGSTLRMTVTGETTVSITATMSEANARMTIVDEGVTYQFQRVPSGPPPVEG